MSDTSHISPEKQGDIDVEWYSGGDLYTRPKRIKVDGRWEDVFHCEKTIREDASSKRRELVFRCHIGDNRIVEIVREISENPGNLESDEYLFGGPSEKY